MLPSPGDVGLDDYDDVDDEDDDEHMTPQDARSRSPSGVTSSGETIAGTSHVETEGLHLRFSDNENEDNLHQEIEIQNGTMAGSPNVHATEIRVVPSNIPTVTAQTMKKKRTSKVLLNVKNMFRSTTASQTVSATPATGVPHDDDSAHMLLSQGVVVPDSPPSFRSPDSGHPKRTLKDRISMLRSTTTTSRTSASTTPATKITVTTPEMITPRAAATTTTTTEEGSESMTSGSPAHQLPQQVVSPVVRRSPVKTLRRFITLPPRDNKNNNKDRPVRYSKRKKGSKTSSSP